MFKGLEDACFEPKPPAKLEGPGFRSYFHIFHHHSLKSKVTTPKSKKCSMDPSDGRYCGGLHQIVPFHADNVPGGAPCNRITHKVCRREPRAPLISTQICGDGLWVPRACSHLFSLKLSPLNY